MKREETYIPYKERTPKELCRDINLRAEKLFLKKDKYGLLFFAVFFLVLVALHLYDKTYVSLWFGFLVVGAIMAGGFVFFKTYFSKKDKYRSLIWGVAILVCVVLEWHEKTYVNWKLGIIVVGGILFVTSSSFIVNKKLVNDMNLAANPKQFFPMAKKLKKSLQNRNFICLSLLIWLPFLLLDDLQDGWWFTCLLILYVVGALFSNRDFWIDSTFNDDLEELEYRLEE